MRFMIREETTADVEAVWRVNAAAFGAKAEAGLVDQLRAHGGLTLLLVAESNAVVIGYIAFSPVTIIGDDGAIVSGIGLAPMAVLPAFQRLGAGSQLVLEGLRRLRADDHRVCVVLGHPGYYPRFGFTPASTFDLQWRASAHPEAFMVQELKPGALSGVAGIVRYRPEIEAL